MNEHNSNDKKDLAIILLVLLIGLMLLVGWVALQFVWAGGL